MKIVSNEPRGEGTFVKTALLFSLETNEKNTENQRGSFVMSGVALGDIESSAEGAMGPFNLPTTYRYIAVCASASLLQLVTELHKQGSRREKATFPCQTSAHANGSVPCGPVALHFYSLSFLSLFFFGIPCFFSLRGFSCFFWASSLLFQRF